MTPKFTSAGLASPSVTIQSSDSSDLSSLPTTIGATPGDLRSGGNIDEATQTGATRSGSPVGKRSTRQRRETKRYCEFRNSISSTSSGKYDEPHPAKRQKLDATTDEEGAPAAMSSPRPKALVRKKPRPEHAPNDPIIDFNNPQDDSDIERDIAESFIAKVKGQAPYPEKYESDVRYFYIHRLPKHQKLIQKLDPNQRKLSRMYPLEDPLDPTITATRNPLFDHRTLYEEIDGKMVPVGVREKSSRSSKTAASTSEQPPTEQPPLEKSTQQSNKGGRSQKGRGTGGSAGRDQDTPEPPQKPMTEPSEKEKLAGIRERQAKVKRLFNSLAGQQNAVLERTTQLQLAELTKKPTAHTTVPEHSEVTSELSKRQDETQALVRAEYDQQIAAANRELGSQAEVIMRQHRTRISEAQREHIKGAQGDLVLLDKAFRASKDDTGTSNGSDIEPYFPRYHEMPEPDARPRGYTSHQIRDEKPFKANLTDYDEQAQREVIEKDIIAPVQKAIAEEQAQRQENVEKQARLDSLVEVTKDELQRAGGYFVARPPTVNPQFALSRLADCAEYVTRYQFVPVPAGDVPATISARQNDPREVLAPPFPRSDTNVAIAPAAPRPSTIAPSAHQLNAPHYHHMPASTPAAPRRLGGPKREPGTITFTPAQTPDSDRFKNPPQPQPLPPGQHVYRPSSLQPHLTRSDSTGSGSGTNKINNTFVNTNPDGSSRSYQASEQARANATRNQVKGAGPKGGTRILLPKNMQ